MARRVPLFATSRIGSTWESFFQPAHKVIVRVPATTSNLGPGFDSFGLALDMTNVLTVERADKFSIEVHGVGAEADDRIPADESNIIVQSCTKAMNMFTKAGEQPFEGAPPLRFESLNCVPSMSGLGSSSNALVLGMAAGLALSGKEVYSPNTKKLLLQLASDEEGHADNISAAIYGGFQVNFKAPTSDRSYQFITQRVHVPKGLHCVLFIPDKAQDRDEARAVMPTGYSRDDTIHNIGRAAMLVNCFATGQFDALRFAMEDRVHQPYRSRFFPVEDLIDAALAAGAHGAFLSSQGPTYARENSNSGPRTRSLTDSRLAPCLPQGGGHMRRHGRPQW
mgnify:CR=1 FL=1